MNSGQIMLVAITPEALAGRLTGARSARSKSRPLPGTPPTPPPSSDPLAVRSQRSLPLAMRRVIRNAHTAGAPDQCVKQAGAGQS
jgi:hypothetical protein